MNDSGLQDVVQDSEAAVKQKLDTDAKTNVSYAKSSTSPNSPPQKDYQHPIGKEPHQQRQHSRHRYEKGIYEGQTSAEAESLYQPTYVLILSLKG
jgi:soluble cytochrome b562